MRKPHHRNNAPLQPLQALHHDLRRDHTPPTLKHPTGEMAKPQSRDPHGHHPLAHEGFLQNSDNELDINFFLSPYLIAVI